MIRIAVFVIIGFLAIACTRSDDGNPGGGIDIPAAGQGNGQRPGVDNPSDYDVIKADATPRYVSDRISLRNDAPGVLVCGDGNGQYRFVNIDDHVVVRIVFEGSCKCTVYEGSEVFKTTAVTTVVDDGVTRRYLLSLDYGSENEAVVVLPYF